MIGLRPRAGLVLAARITFRIDGRALGRSRSIQKCLIFWPVRQCCLMVKHVML
jgi:hypothetical protein